MRIQKLTLWTHKIDEQRIFYRDVMSFPFLNGDKSSFTVQVGATELTFRETSEEMTAYHFAVAIPRNKVQQAKAWLESRVELLEHEGSTEVVFDGWQARAFYFRDAAENILEFIAHERLPDADGEGFVLQDIRAICEIGMPVEDVWRTVGELKKRLQLDPPGDISESFAFVGDVYGVFILVSIGRGWLPTGDAARVQPVEVTINGESVRQIQVGDYPYAIVAASEYSAGLGTRR